jgi:large subunit ribosomal protein L27
LFFLDVFKFSADCWRSTALKRRGSKHNPGENVYISKDHTLHARVDGIVKFQKKAGDKSFVSIIPFEA